MVKIIANWERSVAGARMVNSTINCEEDQDDNATIPQQETQQYEFWDGDNRKSFLRERPPRILYLWHLCHMYGILMKIRQQLQGNCVVDGTNAPSVDTSSCQKRKHSSSSTSVSDHDGLTTNMEQIVESINGLVGVMKQSHQTQQMNILHRRHKEFEDTVQALDNSCMELELNMLEESCPRKKKVFWKMLDKKGRSRAKQEQIGTDNTINSQS